MNPPIPMKSPLTRLGKNYVVYTSAIISPSQFYVVKEKNLLKMGKYSRAIEKFLEDFPIFDMGIMGPLQNGSCAVKVADHWLRANILEIRDGSATLELVDIGGMLRANIYDLRRLPPALTLSTGKAIRVGLNNLEPKFKGPWPNDESQFFGELLAGRPLNLTGVNCHGENGSVTLGIELHDQASELDIRQILLDRGFANQRFTNDPLLTTAPAILINPTHPQNNDITYDPSTTHHEMDTTSLDPSQIYNHNNEEYS